MAEPWWRTGPQDVHRLEDRVSSLYAERCHIDRDDNAIVLITKARVVHVPAAFLAVLLIGPGSRITHAAVTLLADSATAICWVGEHGVRLYASGLGTARGSQLQLRQAWLVTRPKERVAVARRMYDMRFPGETTSRLTLQQLRGREGIRVRKLYAEHSARTGVPWTKRDYKPFSELKVEARWGRRTTCDRRPQRAAQRPFTSLARATTCSKDGIPRNTGDSFRSCLALSWAIFSSAAA